MYLWTTLWFAWDYKKYEEKDMALSQNWLSIQPILPGEHNCQSDTLQNILEQLLMPVKLATLYAYCFLNMSSVG